MLSAGTDKMEDMPASTPAPVRHVTDDERRARLATRHALHPEHRVSTVEQVVEAMTVLHATEAASVHLAVAARSDRRVGDVERALYDDRTLVKQLAMRRTLFVFPRALLPAALASSSARVAATERARHAVMLEKAGHADDGAAWFEAAEAAALAVLSDGVARTSGELRALLPEHDVLVDPAPGKPYSSPTPVAPWIMTHLAADGVLVRGRNAGHWRINKPAWTLMSRWLGEELELPTAREGYAVLVERRLRTFGPGTEDDVQWWLGDTKTVVRRALADLGAVPVSLDSGQVGWVLPDDVDAVEPVPPSAALLPVLDPTVMGWKARGFYLPDPARHTDRAGNIGATAWWDGRVVGAWVQSPDGQVHVSMESRVPAAARKALDAEAARLTAWLDGEVGGTIYNSVAAREAKAALG
jgi:hypothetical protein